MEVWHKIAESNFEVIFLPKVKIPVKVLKRMAKSFEDFTKEINKRPQEFFSMEGWQQVIVPLGKIPPLPKLEGEILANKVKQYLDRGSESVMLYEEELKTLLKKIDACKLYLEGDLPTKISLTLNEVNPTMENLLKDMLKEANGKLLPSTHYVELGFPAL